MGLGDNGFAVLLKRSAIESQYSLCGCGRGYYIKQRGGEFRKGYESPETLCSFVPRGVPVLVTSATMPLTTLEHIRSELGMNAERPFHLNLGNDRRNIVPLAWPIEDGASNLAAFNSLVRGRDPPLRTIICFNNKRLAMRACNNLRKRLPPSKAHTADVLHASHGTPAKKEVIEHF